MEGGDLRVVDNVMTIEDLDAIMLIENASFPAPWTRTMFVNEIMNPNSVILVFRWEAKIVGYRCHWTVTDEAHLMTIAVHPAYRQRGLGKFMMEHLEAQCLKGGLRRIVLEVATKNEPAKRLYRRCGFRTIGFRKNYYGILGGDAFIMEKALENPQRNTAHPLQENGIDFDK